MDLQRASLHQLRGVYGNTRTATEAIDAELDRRHQASLRKERRNLKANGIKEAL